MSFESLTLEVDGTLRNPVVLWSVVAWSVVLSVLAAWFLNSWPKRRRFTPFVVVAFFATPFAQFAIGNVAYSLHDSRVVSVGFWGGPPMWQAPLAGVAVGSVVFLFSRRRENLNAA
jgi:hypothetical protein